MSTNRSGHTPGRRLACGIFRMGAVLAASLACLSCALHAWAQAGVHDRITEAISANQAVALKGSVHPLAQSRYDAGPLSGNTRINGVSIYFKPSAAQQADLNLLLQAQQTPSSPYYHQWLTPQQYASRFGMSADDLNQVQTWLQSQGFQIDSISNSHNRISFSGSVAQINSAFQTQMHRYQVNGESHIANATELSIPAALSGVVVGVRNLSDFRPKARQLPKPSPRYTASNGSHYVVPDDFTTIYDVKAQYNAGYTGSGQTIAVAGQSAIEASDVANFRAAAGLPANPPTLTQVPNTGTSTVDDTNGDEDESDLDVEWSGAIAKEATINFVYVGNNSTYSVFDALQYAVDNNLAPVISISYGACEADNTVAETLSLQGVFEQANLQGQTIVAAAGDDGAADCEVSTSSPGSPATVENGDQATQGLAVDFPGSSPDVTSVGGTEFAEGSGDYWNGSNDTAGGSATGYIPEEVWNDTSTSIGIAAGGGGKSILFGKPSWQTGTGVPADGARDVPDIALAASSDHDGYLVCASGYNPAKQTETGDSTICSSGFADSSGNLDVFGGTSFGAPIFSGLLALINQQSATAGQGNVNPVIYAAAAASPTAFHDVTAGNNEIPCVAGSPDCGSSGEIGYAAAPGYDLASGWGSFDAYKLAQAFAGQIAGSTASLVGTTTVLTASTTTPTINSSVTFTAAVASDDAKTTPTGTVQFTVDGTAGSAVTLSSGTATDANTFTTAGSHTVVANYSGDSAHSASSSSLTITVASTTSVSKGSFGLSATNVSVAPASSGTSTVTVTPSGGYTGTVSLTVSAPSSLTDSCYSSTNAVISGTSPATATITIYTTESACTTAGRRHFSVSGSPAQPSSTSKLGAATGLGGLGAAFASVFLFGLTGRRKRLRSALLGMAFLGVLSWGIGCGGGSSSATSSETSTSTSASAPAGTYTMTVTGDDTTNNVSSTPVNFTLTVQ